MCTAMKKRCCRVVFRFAAAAFDPLSVPSSVDLFLSFLCEGGSLRRRRRWRRRRRRRCMATLLARPLARSRCPGFNSHSALFSHHGRSASCRVRSTLLCCLLRSPTDRQATMRRRCDDDKRGARIIELPAIPSLPPPLSIEISRNKGIPAIAAKNIPQTDRLRSLAPVSAVGRRRGHFTCSSFSRIKKDAAWFSERSELFRVCYHLAGLWKLELERRACVRACVCSALVSFSNGGREKIVPQRRRRL